MDSGAGSMRVNGDLDNPDSPDVALLRNSHRNVGLA